LKLRPSGSNIKEIEWAAGCAFLATQIAPGSLEHLELLKEFGGATVVPWYAMFAALQFPVEVLQGVPGLGHRVLRDLSEVFDPVARPSADIAFAEMRIIERAGIDTIIRRLGHVGEIEVELIPGVTSSFSIGSRTRQTRESEQPIVEASAALSPNQTSAKSQMKQLLSLMTEVLKSFPEESSEYQEIPKIASRRNKRSAKP
jgi:hypothetical protein